MKNIYVTVNPENHVIMFSKSAVKKFKEIYPNSIINTVENIETAFRIIRPNTADSKKVYAIRNGRVTCICYTVSEYDNLIRKVKQSVGKKCKDVYDAYRFIYNKQIDKSLTGPVFIKDESFIIDDSYNVVYTDGSYFENTNLMGIGYEIHNNGSVFSHSSFIKTEKRGSSTIAEMFSVMMAVDRAVSEGIKKVVIMHDNEYVRSCINNKSKKSSFSKKYYKFITDAYGKIDIKFQKVKAHSGNLNNNKVDNMAKHSKIDKFLDMM